MLIRRLHPETFRRICMSFDVWVVSFGLSRVLVDLKMMRAPLNYSVLVAAMVLDAYLLYVFFTKRARMLADPRPEGVLAADANGPPPDSPRRPPGSPAAAP